MFIVNEKPLLIVSLFDLTGVALKPWHDAGYKVLQIDLQSPAGLVQILPGWYSYGGDCFDAIEIIEQVKLTEGAEVHFVSCFPPCTDLAVSGARWFKSKIAKNPEVQVEAMALVYLSRDIIARYNVAGYVENPVSMISSFWRKPDYNFHPWHFTARALDDNYTKKTCLWTSDKFRMPYVDIHPQVEEAVRQVVQRFGRFYPKPEALSLMRADEHSTMRYFVNRWYPDDRIHKAPPSSERGNIRSVTPTGWSGAVAEVNQ